MFVRLPLALTALLAAAAPALATDDTWAIAGRQGIIIHVIVPLDQSRDQAAYAQQIPKICGDKETCFVNFYTNSTGAPVTVPLPDAISEEPTAVLRRSAKQGTEGIRWSCRLALPEPDCF